MFLALVKHCSHKKPCGSYVYGDDQVLVIDRFDDLSKSLSKIAVFATDDKRQDIFDR